MDASALAALLFGEPEAGLVAERLGDARLVAPALLAFELANVCLTTCRRHPMLRAALMEAFALRERLRVEEVSVDHDAVLGLAQASGLTVYDATYLWLARQIGADIVTLDRQLAAAG